MSRHGNFGEFIDRARMYTLRKFWSAHEWRVPKLRINRFKPRVVDAADIAAAAMADGDAEDAEGNEEALRRARGLVAGL
jgi:hypothetical protein